MKTLISILIFFLFSSVLHSSWHSSEYYSKKEQFNILVHTTDTLKLSALIGKSWEFRTINLDSAFYYSDMGLNLLNKFTHKNFEAKILDNRSSLHQMKGNLDSAELLQLKSLIIRTKEKDYKGLVSSYKGLGEISKRRGNFKNALLYYNKSLSTIDSIKFDMGSSLTERQNLITESEKLVEEIYRLDDELREGNSYTNKASYLDFKSFKNENNIVSETEKSSQYYAVVFSLFLVLSVLIIHFYKSE